MLFRSNNSNLVRGRKIWSEDFAEARGHYHPYSWERLRSKKLSPSENMLASLIQESGRFDRVALGAGCFWHVEHALSRLPGVVNTTVGFAGGTGKQNPTYADVSNGDTGHAEVVLVTFDPLILSSRTLFDCFFAMHDPSMVRSHGKRAQGSGQYRSCIIVESDEMSGVAEDALDECQKIGRAHV